MIQRKPCRWRAARRGAAVVELAVLMPFLIIILVWTLYYGLIFFCCISTGNCAVNGGYWVVYQNNGDQYPYASANSAGLAAADPSVPTYADAASPTDSNPTNPQSGTVSVIMDDQFSGITLLLPATTTIQRKIVAPKTPSMPK